MENYVLGVEDERCLLGFLRRDLQIFVVIF